MANLLTYAEIASVIRPNIIKIARDIEDSGFNPDIEFDSNTMDFILSKDYIGVDKETKAICEVYDCLRMSKRNNLCKVHNVELYPEEKCKKKGCYNLKNVYNYEKDIFCHKHRLMTIVSKDKNEVLEKKMIRTGKALCSVDKCKKVARRNNVCKEHNLQMYPHEKCNIKKCNNLKDFTKKDKNDYCYRHKEVKITMDYILTMT